MEAFLDEMLVILPLLGLPAFEIPGGICTAEVSQELRKNL
jgi:hypothetical protein